MIFPRCVERDAKSLIKHLLAHDLTKRYGCLVVREQHTHTPSLCLPANAWAEPAVRVVVGGVVLAGDPQGGAEDIKQHRWFDGFDWEGLFARRLKAPFAPEVSEGELTHTWTLTGESKAWTGRLAGWLTWRAGCWLAGWLVLQVRGPTDTHNFDQYPDSAEEAKEPTYPDGDPFLNF